MSDSNRLPSRAPRRTADTLRDPWRLGRVLRLGIAALVVAAGLAEAAKPPPSRPDDDGPWQLSDDLDVSVVRLGVWLHTSWRTLDGGYRFPSNGLLVRDGEGLLLIDTAWGAEATEELLDWAEATLQLRVERAVATHFHDDRLGGSPVLAAREIPLFALPLTRELAQTDEAPWPEPLADLAVGESVAFGPVEVFYPGPGHTRDNLVVWLPDSRLLFGGCAVRPASTSSPGNTADADVEEWPASIRRVQAKFPGVETVVPSHGPPGGAELLAHTLRILERGPAPSAPD